MAGVGSEVHHNIMVPMLNRERESVVRGEERVTVAPKLAAICLRRFFARKLFKFFFNIE